MKKFLLLTLVFLMITGLASAFAAEAYTYEDVSGCYDLVFEWGNETEVDKELNIFLTPLGHGRLNNSNSSITFDYTIVGNRIDTGNSECSMTYEGNGRITLHLTVEGIELDLPYIRRENVEVNPTMAGKWKLKSMKQNSTVYSEQMLKLIGVTIEITCYENGTIDWYAKTDTEGYTAQGWGVDDMGLYFDNGADLQRVTITGDIMEIKMYTSGGVVTDTYTRMD